MNGIEFGCLFPRTAARYARNNKSRVARNGGQTRVDQEETMARPRARVTRRQMLRAGAGALFVPFTLKAGKAPAQGGKKPFEGVTLNISCWSATYPKLIADYLPEFTEKTGIKVNYDTP